jgi:hypothetical protein
MLASATATAALEENAGRVSARSFEGATAPVAGSIASKPHQSHSLSAMGWKRSPGSLNLRRGICLGLGRERT